VSVSPARRSLETFKDVVPEGIESIVQLALNPGAELNLANEFGSDGASTFPTVGGLWGWRRGQNPLLIYKTL